MLFYLKELLSSYKRKKERFNFRLGVQFLWLKKHDLMVIHNGSHDPLIEFLLSNFTSLEKKTLSLESTRLWLLIKNYWTVRFFMIEKVVVRNGHQYLFFLNLRSWKENDIKIYKKIYEIKGKYRIFKKTFFFF